MLQQNQLLLGLIGLTFSCAVAQAQFNNQWLTFQDETATRLPGGAFSVSDLNTEVDLDWADLDQDGFTDLVVVRKEPFSTLGLRTNLLLMNEGGVLIDRSLEFASATDVPGDTGFLTPTNDRDVQIIDVDNDGWLDVVTSVALSEGLSKAIGHPRIYMNLGDDLGGNWLGLRFEEARIPQLLSFSTGLPENPMFCAVAVGDVTGDGFADLYFCDYDSVGVGGPPQAAAKDLNDRLLINDGNGYFTDQSQLRMTSQMLLSAFGTSAQIGDFNGDGVNDVLKDTALNAPSHVAISYNDPTNPGFFNLFHDFHFLSPYHTSAGDLNNDGRLDVVVSDDNDDRMRINMGNDVFGRVIWSNTKTFDFLTGGDDSFASNNLVVDLDGDGWNEVLVADIDVHFPGYDRRLHIYHNLTTTVGTEDVILREERESAAPNGWVGAVGLRAGNLNATHDIAAFDLENDGDVDLIIARKDGTQVYTNGASPTGCGFTNYGLTAGGANALSLNGAGALQTGANVALSAAGIESPSAWFFLSSAQADVPLLGGTLLIDLSKAIVPLQTLGAPGGTSTWNLAIPANPALAGMTGYAQAAALSANQPGGIAFSNGVELVVCP